MATNLSYHNAAQFLPDGLTYLLGLTAAAQKNGNSATSQSRGEKDEDSVLGAVKELKLGNHIGV